MGDYFPDFIVKSTDGTIWIIETKGAEDVDVLPKWDRLKLWCEDATTADPAGRTFRPLYVLHDKFKRQSLSSFAELVSVFENAQPTKQLDLAEASRSTDS